MKRTTVAGLLLATLAPASQAAPIAPLQTSGNADRPFVAIDYYQPYYGWRYSPYYRPYYRSYYYNPYYVPYYYYGCQRFWSWSYLYCAW
jgi:hypothetical protein